MIIDEDNYLAHYGILRRSGRYPWGSGGNAKQRANKFMDLVAGLRNEGLSDVDIAKGFGMTTKELREAHTIALNAKRAAETAFVMSLKEKGYSNVEIGKRIGKNESSVRSILARGIADREDVLTTTANMLRDEVGQGGFIDVGKGVSNQLQISNEKLGSALAILKDEGYEVIPVQVDQAGTSNKTTLKVLCPPGTKYLDVKNNMEQIRQIEKSSDNGGRTYFGILPPKSLDSKRVAINYAEDGGAEMDGVMYIRPGKEDLSLGGARYAQVRVLVDGTHYLKGMAMYKDDLPAGVDVVFNTNKKRSDAPDKFDVLKKTTGDPDNPFGAMISRQIGPIDKDGNLTSLTSVMNVVNQEGDWEGWKKSISSQVLSKQSPKLAQKQLDKAYDSKKADLDEILALTNPEVKKKLLQSFADSADSSAVNLKAAALKGQASHVILPIKSMKDTEIYAPNYNDGDRVALIRYPHGGKFEIPELTVNNKHPEAKSLLGQARDAVGINSKVAEHLSGADFDGDTVLVIPNAKGDIKTQPMLEGLKNFDPKAEYPKYEGMHVMTAPEKGFHMGMVSNLITDMTIQGASNDELARAVRHSMVVIDAEKHELDYKLSAERNGIRALQKKYQSQEGGRYGGASTLISRASSPASNVRARRPRPMKKGGPIDKATGKLVFEPTDEHWIDKKTGNVVYKKARGLKKLQVADDAHSLVSKNGGTPIERVYADHSNRMKALANEARRVYVNTENIRQSRSAKDVYAKEVQSLNAKLNEALRNSPRERQAQLFAAAVFKAKREANPNMDSAQLKRVRTQALVEGRSRFNAKKKLVDITDREWDAIQAGAISSSKLKGILNNTDLERVKELATPRPKLLMSGSNLARAKQMQAAGRTQAEIAAALGVSLTTVKEGLKNG